MPRLLNLGLVLAVLPILSPLSAATLTVGLNGDVEYSHVQFAIDDAADGDTVLVQPGEYVIAEPINFNRLHDPDDPASPPVKNIVVMAEGGPEVTTIRMAEEPTVAGSVLVFNCQEGEASVLEGFQNS